MSIKYFVNKSKILRLPDIKSHSKVTTTENERLKQPNVTYRLDSIFNTLTVNTVVTTMLGDIPNYSKVKGLYDILKDRKIQSIDSITPKFRVSVVYSVMSDKGEEISGGNRFAFIEPEIVVVLSDISSSNKMSYTKELRFAGAIEHNVTDDIPFEVKFRKELNGYRLKMKNIIIEAHTFSEEEQMSTHFKSQKPRRHKDMTTRKGYTEIFNMCKMFPTFDVEYDVEDRYRKINFNFCISLDNVVELYSDEKIQQILEENNSPDISEPVEEPPLEEDDELEDEIAEPEPIE